MDECYYYAWNLFFLFLFSPFCWRDFSHQDLTKGLSTSNLEYDKSQTIYFPPHNSGANFAESVFVIDNYSGSSSDWQTE